MEAAWPTQIVTTFGRPGYLRRALEAGARGFVVKDTPAEQLAAAVRTIGVTEFTYYRWRKEYGGLQGDQVKRLKELETENARRSRAVSDLTLDKLILKEAARGNF